MNSVSLQQKPTRNKWEILILIWVAFFLNQADRQAFNIVLPLIQAPLSEGGLALTDSQVGSIATGLKADFIICRSDYTGKRVFMDGKEL